MEEYPMSKRLDEIREQTIAKATQVLNEYFDEMSKGCEDQTCDINDFERITKMSRGKTDEIFRGAMGETMSSIETEVKKNAQNAVENSDD